MLSFWFEVNVNIGISEMCQRDNLSMSQFGDGSKKWVLKYILVF